MDVLDFVLESENSRQKYLGKRFFLKRTQYCCTLGSSHSFTGASMTRSAGQVPGRESLLYPHKAAGGWKQPEQSSGPVLSFCSESLENPLEDLRCSLPEK